MGSFFPRSSPLKTVTLKSNNVYCVLVSIQAYTSAVRTLYQLSDQEELDAVDGPSNASNSDADDGNLNLAGSGKIPQEIIFINEKIF